MILDNKISKVFEQFDKALMNQSTIDVNKFKKHFKKYFINK